MDVYKTLADARPGRCRQGLEAEGAAAGEDMDSAVAPGECGRTSSWNSRSVLNEPGEGGDDDGQVGLDGIALKVVGGG